VVGAEAAETRKGIVRAAACKFREKGIVATGLAELMKAAGLTHGGFYKHFASKDQLVAEATTAALDMLLEGMAAHPTIKAAAAAYLSTRHRDNPASGCPLAALGGELARSDKKAREAATAGFVRLVDIRAGKDGTADARRRALVAAARSARSRCRAW
jgi:TetR/AcrR family transcriptional repressor of nem operon